jgi:Glycosyl transferase family 2
VSAPLVTVGIPVYNGERYLARALDSLLAQTFDDFEIVLCDNASEDRTAEICAAYANRDPRIRFYRNPQNLGLVRNFNRTFELAKGTYFKWASHDDWHARESLELTVKALEANPDAALCGTGVSIVDEDGIEYDRWSPPGDLRLPEPHQRLRNLLWTLGRYPHEMFGLLRADTLRHTQLMRNYLGSDRVMLAELSLLGSILYVPETLHFYTVARQTTAPPASVKYDPANAGRVQLRTWRMIYEHLRVVQRSSTPARHKLFLAGSVLGRFGVRERRRMAAEIFHYGRKLAVRSRHRMRPSSPSDSAR